MSPGRRQRPALWQEEKRRRRQAPLQRARIGSDAKVARFRWKPNKSVASGAYSRASGSLPLMCRQNCVHTQAVAEARNQITTSKDDVGKLSFACRNRFVTNFQKPDSSKPWDTFSAGVCSDTWECYALVETRNNVATSMRPIKGWRRQWGGERRRRRRRGRGRQRSRRQAGTTTRVSGQLRGHRWRLCEILSGHPRREGDGQPPSRPVQGGLAG